MPHPPEPISMIRPPIALLLVLTWLVLSGLVPVVASCGGSPDRSGAGTHDKVSVVATTTQTADFARVIGGGDATVYDVIRANVDPHDYEPSPADLDAIAKADVIVKNGVGLERWLDPTIRSAESKAIVVDSSKGVKIRRGNGEEDRAGDPHIWHNPQNAIVMVTNIEKAFEKSDPARREDFRRNLAAYVGQLNALDADIAAQIGSLTDKKLVTNHDAFGYYVDHFGLQFVGSIIPSFDTSAELSARDISDLVARIRSTGTTTVFSEHSLPPKTARALAREAGVDVVAGADSLYGDSLGPAGSTGDTYLKMERHNTREIVDHLR